MLEIIGKWEAQKQPQMLRLRPPRRTSLSMTIWIQSLRLLLCVDAS
jgi:hypothetical protein